MSDDFGWTTPDPTYRLEDAPDSIKELYELDPKDVVGVIRRFWELLPEGHTHERPWFAMALIGHLCGMDLRTPETPEEITACADDIEAMLTIEHEGGKYKVGTMKGAIHSLQFDTLEEHLEATLRLMDKDAEIGVPGPWTCPFCGDTWVDGTEPNKCPDCDALLMRATVLEKPDKEGS